MGRMNEDVFSCKKCEQSVVYEPYNDTYVECYHCGAKHIISQSIDIKLIEEDK